MSVNFNKTQGYINLVERSGKVKNFDLAAVTLVTKMWGPSQGPLLAPRRRHAPRATINIEMIKQ